MGPKYEYARYCIPLIVNESPPEIINNSSTEFLIHKMAPSVTLAASYI